MILVAYRHGLRAAELCDLRWEQVDMGRNACLHVRRVKGGTPATHPIQGDELRPFRELRRQYPDSDYVSAANAAGPSLRTVTTDKSNALVPPPSCRSRSTLTCFATPAVMRWPTRGTTPVACRLISVTRTSSTPCATPRCRPRRSRTFGATEFHHPAFAQPRPPGRDCPRRRGPWPPAPGHVAPDRKLLWN